MYAQQCVFVVVRFALKHMYNALVFQHESKLVTDNNALNCTVTRIYLLTNQCNTNQPYTSIINAVQRSSALKSIAEWGDKIRLKLFLSPTSDGPEGKI